MIIKKPLPLPRVVAVTAAVIALGTGCVRPVSSPPPTPLPSPPSTPTPSTQPAPIVSPTMAGGKSWTFAYTPGVFTYTVVTDGQLSLMPDTAHARALPRTVQTGMMTVTVAGDVQLTNVPALASTTCDSTASFAEHITHLLPKFPRELTMELTWGDSITVEGCHGTIPTTTHVAHVYIVAGDTTFNGLPALHVRRSDIVNAKGEGSEGQHQILLTAVGTGTSDLFLDLQGGQLIASTTTQTSKIDILTSGRVNHFVQRITEQVTLHRMP